MSDALFRSDEMHDLPLTPTQALLVHQSGPAYHEQVMLTSHTIVMTPTGAVLGDGVAFGTEDVAALINILAKRTASRDNILLPASVLVHGAARLVWMVRAKVRPMWFVLGRKSYRFAVPWPTLILDASESGLRVAALASTRRPGARSALFHAPLMNVYANSAVCLGNAVRPGEHGSTAMKVWEQTVFESNFSHVNHEHTLALRAKQVNNDAHLKFWSGLDRKAVTRFPISKLVPMHMTLQRWLSAN